MFTELTRSYLLPITETEASDITSISKEEDEEVISLTALNISADKYDILRLEKLNYTKKMLDPKTQYLHKSPAPTSSIEERIDESRASSTISLENAFSTSAISVSSGFKTEADDFSVATPLFFNFNSVPFIFDPLAKGNDLVETDNQQTSFKCFKRIRVK